MIRIFYFLLFIFMMTACKSGIPENILPPAKMQAVKWDMMQADEMVEYYKNLDSTYSTDKNRTAHYQQILQVHKITKEQFENSLHYYESNPELLKKVLDSMHKQGERLQQKIKTRLLLKKRLWIQLCH